MESLTIWHLFIFVCTFPICQTCLKGFCYSYTHSTVFVKEVLPFAFDSFLKNLQSALDMPFYGNMIHINIFMNFIPS